MKKKYLILTLMVFIIGLTSIKAINIVPKVNDKGFNVGDKADFKVGNSYDFSLISFKSNENGKTIIGKSDMKMIYCGTDNDYFTAYCMDGNKKYPEYEYYANNKSSEELIKFMTIFEVLKECNSTSSCTIFDNLAKVTGYDISGIDTPTDETITSFDNGETINSSLTRIAFAKSDGTAEFFTAAELATALKKNLDGNKLTVSFKKSDFTVNHYSASNMPDSVGYKKALWIIEHSYPTLTLEETFDYASVNFNTTVDELLNALRNRYDTTETVCVTYKGSNVKCDTGTNEPMPESAPPESAPARATIGTDASISLEEYVYGTVQYALWQVIGEYYELDGNTRLYLSDELYGSKELNKLYKFLIKDRENYDNPNYETKITLELPAKELYKSENDAEYYGPYKIKSNMLITNWDTLTALINSPSTGVTLVDKDLNELQKKTIDGKEVYIVPNLNEQYGEFYIRIDNKAKDTTTVNITVDVSGKSYNNDSDRGRLFYSESELDQVVGISARITDVKATNELKLEFNAKTGDYAIGTVLLAVLGAFTVGYIALRFKEEPIGKLN